MLDALLPAVFEPDRRFLYEIRPLDQHADNHGEGGILALLALAQEAASSECSRILLVLLALGGAALFYGDSIQLVERVDLSR